MEREEDCLPDLIQTSTTFQKDQSNGAGLREDLEEITSTPLHRSHHFARDFVKEQRVLEEKETDGGSRVKEQESIRLLISSIISFSSPTSYLSFGGTWEKIRDGQPVTSTAHLFKERK